MLEQIATKIITKYLRKGNMSRCLRDILPTANLTNEQREFIAEITHDVVRWKRLYDLIIDETGRERTPETYVQLARNSEQNDKKKRPFEYRHSCSDYVANILKKHEEWAKYLNTKPPTTLCVNFNKSSIEEVIEILKQENLTAQQSQLKTAIFTNPAGRYSSVIKNRYAHVQDESSQLIAYIASSFGDKILDLCAGNGGKSLSIASITRNKKNLYAYELNEKKRLILNQRCQEYNARITVEDRPSQNMFDVLLVDAPCTGIGAVRRNPEAKYVEGPDDFPKIQLDILEKAAQNVTNSGILLYSVCTFTPEETEEVVKKFLKTNGFTTTKLSGQYSEFLLQNKYGAFTNIPKGDIFFISALKKQD